MARRVKRGDELPPVRGLWICKTSDTRRTKETAAYRWVKTGKMPPRVEGCFNWNVYIGRKNQVVGIASVVDAICKRCGRRVKFQVHRQDNRGTVSPAHFMARPHTMPKKALIEEMLARNRRESLDREIEGFQKASDLMKGGA